LIDDIEKWGEQPDAKLVEGDKRFLFCDSQNAIKTVQ
jgi:hypothetical protein